jgi:hypothetical protein
MLATRRGRYVITHRRFMQKSTDEHAMDEMTPDKARCYIGNFTKYIIPGTEYVDFPSSRIYINNMTDDEAVKVAHGLMEIEARATKGTRQ